MCCRTGTDLYRELDRCTIGDDVDLEVLRGSEKVHLKVTLGYQQLSVQLVASAKRERSGVPWGSCESSHCPMMLYQHCVPARKVEVCVLREGGSVQLELDL